MLKLVFPLRRLPTLSREEFQRYWYETHGPLVRRHAKALRIRRYVQLHTLDDPRVRRRPSARALEPADGVWGQRKRAARESARALDGPPGTFVAHPPTH